MENLEYVHKIGDTYFLVEDHDWHVKGKFKVIGLSFKYGEKKYELQDEIPRYVSENSLFKSFNNAKLKAINNIERMFKEQIDNIKKLTEKDIEDFTEHEK